jgi:hypothetical protein
MKDKERLERLSTVRAAEKDMKEELQEKIQQKQVISPVLHLPSSSEYRPCNKRWIIATLSPWSGI